MSRRFRFTKECLERLKHFALGGKDTENKSKPAPAEKTAAETEPVVTPSPSPEKEQPAAVVKETVPEDKKAEPASEKSEKKTELFIHAVSRTDVGKVRPANQDCLIEGRPVYGIADGMGGHKGGETASALARDTLLDALKEASPSKEALLDGMLKANAAVYQKQLEDDSLSGMGTTMTVLWAAEDEMLIGHVGDSRCYRLRDHEWKQMTEDHSLVSEMVRSGILTPEQAARHPMRNVITRAVGTEDTVEADFYQYDRRKDDIWLLCSDGLHSMVADEDLKGVLETLDLEEAADKLLQMALDAGGRDNISFIILKDKEADA